MRQTSLLISLPIAIALAGGFERTLLADSDPPHAEVADHVAQHLTFLDRRIAANIALDAQAEIQLVQFAAAHAVHPSVKQFADAMAKDFDLLAVNMDALSGSLASPIWNSKAGTDVRPESPVRMINVERMALSIKLEVVRESARYVEAELKLLPAEEFDRAYLRAHALRLVQMTGALKALERHASPAYASTLGEAIKLVQHDLAQAKAIGASLEPLKFKSVDGAKVSSTDRK